MKKYRIAICLIGALLLTLFIPSKAWGQSNGKILLWDNGQTLSESEKAELSQKLEAVSARRGCDLAVVTLRTLGGRNVQRYAHELYDTHGYGQGGSRDGILLLISVSEREYAFSVNGFANDSLSNRALDLLQEKVEGPLSADDYAGAIADFTDCCDYLLDLARQGKGYNPFPWAIVPISAILGFLIALVTVLSMKRRLATVHPAYDASNCVRKDSLKLSDCRDLYLYSAVSRVPKPKSNPPGGSGKTGGSTGASPSRGGRSGHF